MPRSKVEYVQVIPNTCSVAKWMGASSRKHQLYAYARGMRMEWDLLSRIIIAEDFEGAFFDAPASHVREERKEVTGSSFRFFTKSTRRVCTSRTKDKGMSAIWL